MAARVTQANPCTPPGQQEQLAACKSHPRQEQYPDHCQEQQPAHQHQQQQHHHERVRNTTRRGAGSLNGHRVGHCSSRGVGSLNERQLTAYITQKLYRGALRDMQTMQTVPRMSRQSTQGDSLSVIEAYIRGAGTVLDANAQLNTIHLAALLTRLAYLVREAGLPVGAACWRHCSGWASTACGPRV